MNKQVRLCIKLAMLAFCFLAFGFKPMKAEATSRTQSEAISWCESKVGTSVGYNDGSGQYQCVEFIQAYYQYLGVSKVSGNGCDYATNALPSGWSRVQGGVPQKGDILVYSGTANYRYGHVAICGENTNVSYHQNYKSKPYVTKENFAYNSYGYINKFTPYWGYIRPNWSGSGAMGKMSINMSDSFYADQNVVVQWSSAANAAQYGLTVRNSSGTDVFDAMLTGNSRNVGRLSPGTYTVFMAPYNAAGTRGTVVRKSITVRAENTPVTSGDWLGADFYAYIITSQNWKHLANNNGNLEVSASNNSKDPKQIWHFINTSNTNQYIIKNEYSGQLIDVFGARTENYTNIFMFDENGGTNQKWYIKEQSDGYFCLIPVHATRSRMDVTNAQFTGGTNIQLHDRNESVAQKFSIYNVQKDNVVYSVPKPAAPKNVKSVQKGKDVCITWSASPKENYVDTNRKYRVEVYNASNKKVYSKDVKETSCTISNLSPGNYKYSVMAYAANYDITKVAAYQTTSKISLKVKAVSNTNNGYKVSFNSNGGKKLSYSSKNVKKGQKIGTLPTVQRTKYAFKGWYTAKNGGSKINENSVINSQQTYYAHWKKVTVKKTGIKSLKSSKKKTLSLKYKKSDKAKGYQIVYSTDKNFAKNVYKTNTKNTSVTIKKLKSGKRYYVKVRPYRKDSAGKKVYGKFSGIKNVKIR